MWKPSQYGPETLAPIEKRRRNTQPLPSKRPVSHTTYLINLPRPIQSWRPSQGVLQDNLRDRRSGMGSDGLVSTWGAIGVKDSNPAPCGG